MAVLAAAGDVWQVKIHGRLEGQEALNVLHFTTQLGDNDVVAHLLTVLLACIVNSLLPGLSNNYFLEKVTGMQVSPIVGPEFEVIPNPTGVVQGQSAGDARASFESCVVSIRTEGAGRTGRGRMFLPAIPEGSASASFISPESPYWGAVVAFVTCLASNFIHANSFPANNTWWLGVMSRKIGGAKPPFLPAGFHKALVLTPHAAISTTRSRKVGHGS
jgi:hypothetical protein